MVNNAYMYRTKVGKFLHRLMIGDPCVAGNENELARLSGVPQPTIHRILTGESENPRRPTLERLAHYFGIEADDFYTGEADLDLVSIRQKALPPPKSADPMLDLLIDSYNSASAEARRLAVLMLLSDAQTSGIDLTDSPKLPKLNLSRKPP